MLLHGWVVTHRDSHDDEESCKRAVTDYATSASQAWSRFIKLCLNSSGDISKSRWVKRGYVARRVSIVVTIEDKSNDKR